MFKKNYDVVIKHDLNKMIEEIKRIESYGGRVYEINDEIDSIIIRYRANKRTAEKIWKDRIFNVECKIIQLKEDSPLIKWAIRGS